ncbi:hypothetical protein ACHAWF_007014 [Thalassiosira exigua]
MESPTPVRRSKRKISQPARSEEPSDLQTRLERAIESPGGVEKVLRLVEGASDEDVGELNASRWTPLVGVAFRLGKNTTRKGNSPESEERLIGLIRACHDRGISVNSSARFGAHQHRPLIIAAYYGFGDAVRLLLELGALPGLKDGEGRNVLFAALQNPVQSGGSHKLRECDRRTAQVLVDSGAVTNDLRVWNRSAECSTCYINGHSAIGSVMSRALLNKNVDVVKFLVGAGAVLTDRDYLSLRCVSATTITPRLNNMSVQSLGLAMVKSRLLPMVAMVLATESEEDELVTKKSQLLVQNANCWTPEIDWSFPPTWKVGVILCQNCGLPPDIFWSYVVQFLGRDWFFTSSDCRRYVRQCLNE